MRWTKYRLPGSLCSAQCTESLVSLSWGVDDDGLKSSKSVQMFAHQLFGSDATVVDSCIMIATRDSGGGAAGGGGAHTGPLLSLGPISDRHGRPSLGKLLDFGILLCSNSSLHPITNSSHRHFSCRLFSLLPAVNAARGKATPCCTKSRFQCTVRTRLFK